MSCFLSVAHILVHFTFSNTSEKSKSRQHAIPGKQSQQYTKGGPSPISLLFHQLPASQPPLRRLVLLWCRHYKFWQTQNTKPGPPKSPHPCGTGDPKLPFQHLIIWMLWLRFASSWSPPHLGEQHTSHSHHHHWVHENEERVCVCTCSTVAIGSFR